MMRLRAPWSTTSSLIGNYAFAICSSGIALSLVTRYPGIEKLGFPLFLAAIAMTVWYVENGPGVLTIVLSTLAYDYFFTPPLHALGVDGADRPYVVGFVLFGLLTAGFSPRRRTIERSLRTARDALAGEVIERTRQASLLEPTHDIIFVRDMHDSASWSGTVAGPGPKPGTAAAPRSTSLYPIRRRMTHDQSGTHLARRGRPEGRRADADGARRIQPRQRGPRGW